MNNIEVHSLSMVHNDMESSLEKSPETILQEQIHSLCIAINVLVDNGVYICKVAPRVGDYSQILITTLYHYFNEVTCFLPSYSNPASPECYMICTEKKYHSLIYPHIVLSSLDLSTTTKNVIISNNILDMKFNMRKEIVNTHRMYGDYLDSSLVQLDEVEKTLMTYGFQINGHKIIKQICGHDVGAGSHNLRAYINSSANNLVNHCDPDRSHSNLLDPYPLSQDSKTRELMDILCKKICIYILLHLKDRDRELRRNIINNLRRKILNVNLSSPSVKGIIQDYLIKKILKIGINPQWIYNLSTPEIKMWWKVVGYSILHTES